jgi:NAD(P)-dependent dehydrogenase (short-subunit alcohol dehydrogenase family)
VAALTEAAPDVDILVNNRAGTRLVRRWRSPTTNGGAISTRSACRAHRLIRQCLPGMIERGRVQNIASDSAVVTQVEMIHYGMSKTALLAVSRGFAKAAAGTGVTVNSVIAGPTHTAGVEDFVYSLVPKELPWDEAQRQFMRAHRPQSLLQRLIEPDEIASLVVYLSSPFASATTGERCA